MVCFAKTDKIFSLNRKTIPVSIENRTLRSKQLAVGIGLNPTLPVIRLSNLGYSVAAFCSSLEEISSSNPVFVSASIFSSSSAVLSSIWIIDQLSRSFHSNHAIMFIEVLAEFLLSLGRQFL